MNTDKLHDQWERARVNEAYERASLRENRKDPDPDGIGAYYKRCAERQEQARKRWEAAKADGADVMELHRLWEAMIDAGNTGD